MIQDNIRDKFWLSGKRFCLVLDESKSLAKAVLKLPYQRKKADAKTQILYIFPSKSLIHQCNERYLYVYLRFKALFLC